MAIVTETLQLETIKDIDPRIEGVFQYHVERARHDCMNRAADKTVRKVLLEFEFEPVMNPESRECDAARSSSGSPTSRPLATGSSKPRSGDYSALISTAARRTISCSIGSAIVNSAETLTGTESKDARLKPQA